MDGDVGIAVFMQD